ncbi:MAG TPA: family 78 glycoside hydrolase catalytic domain [Streptosporangiaceae bacterium]|nr:family 78 glycoside hydrolase catalytic domain [Streptosporangiaceae bacterium]
MTTLRPAGPLPVGLLPVGLRCAHLEDPLGVAPDRVRFGWQLDGSGGSGSLSRSGSGRLQTGYQIQVHRGQDLTWDSGQVQSADCGDISYDGLPLVRGGQYTWRVRVWDEAGTASDWAPPGRFEIELDQAGGGGGDVDAGVGVGGWQASWIGLGPIRESFTAPAQGGSPDPVASSLNPAPYLRLAFDLAGPVRSARLYVTALGLYEARLNGHRVGDAFLAPGWTDYAKRVQYQTYDVTGLLREGENVIGAIIADGWYSGFAGFNAKRAGAHYGDAPELLAQLAVTLADGSQHVIVTDDRWRARFAAIRHADLLMGEMHDLRLEPHGWDAPGYDASVISGWRRVESRPRDTRLLVADPGPPIRVTQELAPVAILTDDARYILDFGQNLTGWLAIKVTAPAGSSLRVRHAETLEADGSLYTDNLRTARQTDEFITGEGTGGAGGAGGAQVLEPRFTMHGFRYAEITGYPGDLAASDVVARVVHSDIAPTGTFQSSQDWLDRLFRVIDWSQRGNFISVPTDCPQRDERLSWLGDAQIFARTACYNRDVASFFAKWMDDVADAQLPSGAFTDIAPTLHIPWSGAPAWSDAGVIVPWTVWKMYGDTAILRRYLGAMAAWMNLLERTNPDYLRSRDLGNSYNDWLAPGSDDTPPELLATAYWAHDAALMGEICEVIGRPDEAAGYRATWAKIRSAFADAFVAADGQLASGTQTAYALGLHMGLVPAELQAAAAGHLVKAIRATDWHLTTGFVGVGYLLPVLSSSGHDDVAYRLLAQESRPSWRYMINQGATTIWERWDGWSAERGFQSAWMNSFNHYALGSVGEWIYRFLLGIDQAPGTAGFCDLVLRPHPGGSVGSARGSYRSVRGPISVGWERSGGQFTYRVELPPNVTATVRLPSGTSCDVGSGAHEFTEPEPAHAARGRRSESA